MLSERTKKKQLIDGRLFIQWSEYFQIIFILLDDESLEPGFLFRFNVNVCRKKMCLLTVDLFANLGRSVIH